VPERLQAAAIGTSAHHSLQVQLTGRAGKGLNAMVAYTLAKAEGDTDGDNFGWTYGTVVAEPGANSCGAAGKRLLAPLNPDGEEPRCCRCRWLLQFAGARS
jgi:hypothetical protein